MPVTTQHILAIIALILAVAAAVPPLRDYYLLHVAVILVCVALLVP